MVKKVSGYSHYISKVLIIGIILMGALLSSQTSYAATAYFERENNNYIGNADVISVGSGNTFSGTLNGRSDIDFIKFTLNKGSKITLDVYGSRPTDYNRWGHINYFFYKAIETDSSFYYGLASYKYNLGYLHEQEDIYLSAGTYYLELSEESIDANIDYKLTFKNVTVWENFSEPNDYMGQATKIMNGKVYKGLLESYNWSGEDFDWFKIKTKKEQYYVTAKNIDIDEQYLYIQAQNSKGESRDFSLSVKEKTSETELVTLPKGTTYFVVWPRGDGRYKFSITKKPSKVTGVKATKKSSKSIRLKWNKKSGITGYKIYRSTNKNSGYSLIKTIKNPNTTSYVDKNKKKKKYYYKIKAYKNVNGYNCGGYYSNIVSKKL